MRVRQTGDKLWLPRPNVGLEKELDAKFERTGKLEWQVPKQPKKVKTKEQKEQKEQKEPKEPKEQKEQKEPTAPKVK